MKPTIKIDTAALSATLKEYAKNSKRDLDEIVNQKAYSILIKAAAQNRVADKNKIRSELGQIATAIRGQRVRVLKNGTIKRGSLIKERIYNSALYAIVLHKAAKQGKKLFGKELEAAAKRELSRRMRAVFFMKSGWFAALAPIAKAIKKPLKKVNQRRADRAFGGGSPARWLSTKTVAKFFNTSFNKPENTTTKNPTKYAEEALKKAIDQEVSTMRERIAKKLEARAKRMAARAALSSGAG